MFFLKNKFLFYFWALVFFVFFCVFFVLFVLFVFFDIIFGFLSFFCVGCINFRWIISILDDFWAVLFFLEFLRFSEFWGAPICFPSTVWGLLKQKRYYEKHEEDEEPNTLIWKIKTTSALGRQIWLLATLKPIQQATLN